VLNVVPFHVALGITYAVNAIVIVTLAWMFHSPRFHAWHIRAPMPMRVSRAQYYWNILPNLALSTVVTTGAIYGLSPWTLTDEPTAWWMILLQGLGVLVLYDFSYYFMHRLFHVKRFFGWVHVVHHQVRFPRAQDSLYQSPLELVAGVGLLMLVVWVVGPIHWAAFIGLFFIYSTLHVFIHSGMLFPHQVFGVKVFGVLNYLTMKHHRHHLNKHGHNFAAVTPIPDLIFGTAA
jgi:sterol desaturase/sphingolipid hydroxylase (fatty acid hydroxylase superfamily)